ncbi:Peptidase S8, subtilisin-related [Trema orientale]|uniref:Peptidase S8, subtilisin-related n=1 Tax=Trema orientale TaxID=63057 RepID=A0A2P5FYJ4_TREOI|nr:Peptidase S8, subtilisin-related [Trema orientale]
MARYGEDKITGSLDTGVWPESKSFRDEGMGCCPNEAAVNMSARQGYSFVLLGNGNGTAKGWPPANDNECFNADIMAAFQAAIKDGVDVLLVSIAGNSGPYLGTVENEALWIVTTGATTIDHEFTNYVALANRKHLKGASLSSTGLPSQNFYHCLLCMPGSLDPKKVKGKILVCLCGNFKKQKKSARCSCWCCWNDSG